MSTQAEIIAKIALKLPLDINCLDILKALNEAYRAGFEQGVNVHGQHHEKVLDTILKVMTP